MFLWGDAPRPPYKVSIPNYVTFLTSCEFAGMSILKQTLAKMFMEITWIYYNSRTSESILSRLYRKLRSMVVGFSLER